VADVSYTLLIDNAPAPAAVLDAVQRLEVEDSLDAASAFRLRLAISSTAEGDWSTLADNLFVPLTPVLIRLNMDSSLGEPLIKGYVTSARVEFDASPGKSFLEITGMDATARMNLEEKVRSWPNLADSDIASLIFAEYGLVPQATPTTPYRLELETTTTQRGTDIRFLRRLAARNGYACYVETDPLIGEVGVFGPLNLAAPAQGVLSVRFGEASNVEKLSSHYEMLRPTTARMGGVEIAGRSVQSAEASTASETSLGANGTLGALSPESIVLPAESGLSDTGELQSYVQGVVDRSAWAVRAQGTLNVGAYGKALRARKPINVRGAGSLYSGTYFVRRVLHTFAGEEYTQQFELTRNALGLIGSELFMDTGALAAAVV
jgi:phage protein D